MNILVTGGAGYIGSHTVRALAASKDFTPVVYDNLSTGHEASVPDNVQLITGDIHDVYFLKHILAEHEIDGVIHFAASSLVGESMKDPAKYYFNNVEGTLHLLIAMHETGVDHIVFSSTAAVYGEPEKTPIEEDFPTVPTNVYGRTKLMIENMMKDFTMAYGMDYVALRYFNAAGAIQDGSIGEDHNPETHLIPLILKTAQGVRDHISIFGTFRFLARTIRHRMEPVCGTTSMYWTWRTPMCWPCSIWWTAGKAPCSIWAVKPVSVYGRLLKKPKRLRELTLRLRKKPGGQGIRPC